MISPTTSKWRVPNHTTYGTLFYAAAAATGVVCGASIVGDARIAKVLIVLSSVALAFVIPPEKIFIAWLFAAPLVQGASSGDHSGHIYYRLLFVVPPVILVLRMVTGAIDLRDLWVVDALPALYVAYIIVSANLISSGFRGESSDLRGIYNGVGIAMVAYYFTAFGRTSAQFPVLVARALIWGGIVVAVFALVEAASGWNLWGNALLEGTQLRRGVSTFTSPGAMGAYLGAGVAFAIAILAWNGPRSLKLPSMLLIGLSVPALYLTYTRGPVLAVALVAVVLALVANRARWPSLLVLATVAIAVFASWGQISSSSVYKDRLGVTSTADIRLTLQHISLELFRERPLFGWGYDTFDQVKLTISTPADRHIIETTTSHDTFLTVLVELGLFGLALLVIPWVVLARRSIAAAWRGQVEPWLVAGCVGATAAYIIGGLTYDSRFFSLGTALPWILLGLARSRLAKRNATPESS
jgi:O-antigen ligase